MMLCKVLLSIFAFPTAVTLVELLLAWAGRTSGHAPDLVAVVLLYLWFLFIIWTPWGRHNA